MTFLLKLSEQIVDDMVSKLQTNYPTRATNINNAYNDGVTISAPLAANNNGGALDGSAYYRSGKWPVAENPAVLVTEVRTSFEKDLEGAHGLTSTAIMRVTILDADQDRERLTKKLQRHRQAVIGALWDDTPVERLATAWYIHPLQSIPGPAERESDVDPWRATTAIDFLVKQYES